MKIIIPILKCHSKLLAYFHDMDADVVLDDSGRGYLYATYTIDENDMSFIKMKFGDLKDTGVEIIE